MNENEEPIYRYLFLCSDQLKKKKKKEEVIFLYAGFKLPLLNCDYNEKYSVSVTL